MRLVGVEDGARQALGDRGLELARGAAGENLRADAGGGVQRRLGPAGGKPRGGLVHVQHAAALEARVEPRGRQPGVELEAGEAEPPDRLHRGVRPPGRARRREAGEPGEDPGRRPQVERAVGPEQPAKPRTERRRRGERVGVARADQPGVARRAAPAELRPPLEEERSHAAAREVERDRRPHRAPAHHDDVGARGRPGPTVAGRSRHDAKDRIGRPPMTRDAKEEPWPFKAAR